MGDFNKVLGLEVAGMQDIAQRHHLLDLFHRKHDQANLPETWNRGKNALTMFCIWKHYVTLSNNAAYGQQVASNHCGMFIDVPFDALIGTELLSLPLPQ